MFDFIEEGLFQIATKRIEERFTYLELYSNLEDCKYPKKLLYVKLEGFDYDTMWLDPNDFLEYRKNIIINIKIGWERKGLQSEFVCKIPM